MTGVKSGLGIGATVVVFWCLATQAQESEMDVVRELLNRFEHIERRVEALEQRGLDAAVPGGSGEIRVGERFIRAILYRVSDARFAGNDLSVSVLHGLTTLGAAGGWDGGMIDLENLTLMPDDCADIRFVVKVRGASANKSEFDLAISGKTDEGQNIKLVPTRSYAINGGSEERVYVDPLFCEAWKGREVN